MGFSVRLDPSSARVLRDGHDDEVGLAELESVEDHIHGELVVEVNDVIIPGLGFFGPRDVCVGAWVTFLAAATQRLREREQTAVTFDDYEQGQPAYLFVRDGPTLTISSIASASGHGPADATWAPQTCELDDFHHGVETFLANLRETLRHVAPTVGGSWLESQISRAQQEPA